jgi:hypothetical protein
VDDRGGERADTQTDVGTGDAELLQKAGRVTRAVSRRKRSFFRVLCLRSGQGSGSKVNDGRMRI